MAPRGKYPARCGSSTTHRAHVFGKRFCAGNAAPRVEEVCAPASAPARRCIGCGLQDPSVRERDDRDGPLCTACYEDADAPPSMNDY